MKPWLKNLLAVILAVTAAFSAYMWTRQYEDKLKSVRVLKLKQDAKLIAGKTILTPEMIEVVELPAQFAKSLRGVALLDNDDGRDPRSAIVGKTPIRDIVGDSLLLDGDFSEEREMDLATQILPGHRALTVAVGAQSTVGFFVRPGSRVDIIGSLIDPGTGQGQDTMGQQNVVTRTLLTNVKVLAVGSARNYDEYQKLADRGYSTVTLELTPQDANLLTFAQQQLAGPLALILRSQTEGEKPAEVRNVDWRYFRERTGK
jgi:Flp pilus assembly protein CpaB